MHILALETATLPASFALADQDRVIQTFRQAPEERAAETLLAQIQEVLRVENLTARDLAVVGLTIGPGSFTGLRCGVAIAKILGYSLGCQVVALDTMQVIAAGLELQTGTVRVVMDAQRNGVYWQPFALHESQPPTPLQPVQTSSVDDLLQRMQPDERIVGPGLTRLTDAVLPIAVREQAMLAEARAEVVAILTQCNARAGQFHDPWTLTPKYVGLSAAEEKTVTES